MLYYNIIVLGNTTNLNGHLKNKHSSLLVNIETSPEAPPLSDHIKEKTVDKLEASTSQTDDTSNNKTKDNDSEKFLNVFKRQRTISEFFL